MLFLFLFLHPILLPCHLAILKHPKVTFFFHLSSFLKTLLSLQNPSLHLATPASPDFASVSIKRCYESVTFSWSPSQGGPTSGRAPPYGFRSTFENCPRNCKSLSKRAEKKWQRWRRLLWGHGLSERRGRSLWLEQSHLPVTLYLFISYFCNMMQEFRVIKYHL